MSHLHAAARVEWPAEFVKKRLEMFDMLDHASALMARGKYDGDAVRAH